MVVVEEQRTLSPNAVCFPPSTHGIVRLRWPLATNPIRLCALVRPFGLLPVRPPPFPGLNKNPGTQWVLPPGTLGSYLDGWGGQIPPSQYSRVTDFSGWVLPLRFPVWVRSTPFPFHAFPYSPSPSHSLFCTFGLQLKCCLLTLF